MANTKITASLLDPAQTSITSLGTLSALTISGDLTVDTSTLKVNSSSNRVGIGTTSPSQLLHVDGHAAITSAYSLMFGDGGERISGNNSSEILNFFTGTTERMRIDSVGRVGIQETSPDYHLHISNASQVGLRIDGSGSGYVQGSILLSSATSGSNAYRGHGIFYWNNESQTEWFLGAPYTDSDRFVINRKASQSTADFSSAYIHASHGQNFLTIENDGKVGIGATAPDTFLHIKGSKTFAATQEHLKIENTATGEPVVLSMMTVADNGGVGNEGAIYFDAGATGVVNDNLLQLSANHQNTTTPQVTIKGDGTVGIGTTSPKRMLQVGDNSQGIAALSLQTTTSGLSRIYMGDNDGTAAEYAGMISYVHSDDQLQLYTSQSNRMVIDSSGRVLIGHNLTSHANGYSTPGGNSGENAHYSKLWIQGNTYSNAGDGRLVLASGTSWPSSGTQIGSIYFSTAWGGDHASIRAVTNGGTGSSDYPASIHFDTTPDGGSSPSERMIIRMDGGIAIPASSSNAGANINGWISHHTNNHFYIRGGTEAIHLMTGNAESSQGRIYLPGGGNNSQWVINNNQVFNLGTGGALLIAGALTQNYSFSDIKLKTDIEDLPSALENLKTLKPISFNWKQESKRRETKEIGIIAQELQKVYPELVEERTRLLGEKDEMEQALHVEYDKLTVVLLKAVQELSAEVESLKEKLNG